MTKPDDIPQDVWDIADEIAASYQMPGGEGHALLCEEIALAIMAERKQWLALVRSDF